MGLYVQYGCGLSAPETWINFDSSPTLRLQKIPVFGRLTKSQVDFPQNVLFGDIVKGLPGIEPSSCDGIYCSHILEHLSLQDFYIALSHTFQLLKPGGIFRCVLPDLERNINQYLSEKKLNDPDASMNFMKNTMLGKTERPKSFIGKVINTLGNSNHLWMWDASALEQALVKTGFKNIRPCKFNDSLDNNFLAVEDESRFQSSIAFESIK